MRSIRLFTRLALAAALFALAPAPVTAQETTPAATQTTGTPAQTGAPVTAAPAAEYSSLPAQAGPPRTLRAYWHVFAAFAIVWTLLFGYALSLGRRFGRLEDELKARGA